jgi:hypothetical protein
VAKQSAKSVGRKKANRKSTNAIDSFSVKRPPGRPGIRKSFVIGSAYNAGLMLKQHWHYVGEPLLSAQNAGEVSAAFKETPTSVQDHFRQGDLILSILRDPKFPTRKEAQIQFLADSLGGRGEISPRRSRDICAEERNRLRHYIIRRDFYIECTCKYKGPALHDACPRCGTRETKGLSLRSNVAIQGFEFEPF